MSTRAIISVCDEKEVFHLYIHRDGNPDKIVPLIEKARSYAWQFPRFEAGDFSSAIIRVMKKWAGDIYITNKPNDTLISFSYEVYIWEYGIIKIDVCSNNKK